MTDKTVYFLRHGEVESNAQHYYAGQADIELTEKGVAQAKAVARLLCHIPFDKVFCSDLKRAKHTASLALPTAVCDYTSQIREMDVGELVFQKVDDCTKKYGELFVKSRAAYDYSPFGGESRAQFDKRIADFMHKLAALEDTPIVCAVCHAGVFRSVTRFLFGENFPALPVDNCSVTVLEYKDGKWELLRWNVVEAL